MFTILTSTSCIPLDHVPALFEPFVTLPKSFEEIHNTGLVYAIFPIVDH